MLKQKEITRFYNNVDKLLFFAAIGFAASVAELLKGTQYNYLALEAANIVRAAEQQELRR